MKKLIAMIMTLCMIFGLSSVGVWADDATWQVENPMPTARSYCGKAITVGEKIYLLSGKNESDYVSTVDILDVKTNTWTTGASITSPSAYPTATVVGKKIYVIGGLNPTVLNAVQIYDTETDTWSTGTDMPTARHGAASVVIGTNIYVMGGRSADGHVKTVEIYNTSTDSWSTGTSLPIERSNLVSNVVANKIYAIGGTNISGQQLITMNIYDASTNTWSSGASMSIGKINAASVVVGDNIYVIGGTTLNGVVKTTNVYSISNNDWRSGPSLNIARNLHSAAVANGKIFVFGGHLSTTSKSVESLQVGESLVVPDSPASLTATGGNSAVYLAWETISGATSYTVKRSTTAGGPYTVIAEDVTGATYSDTDVTNGTTYYYVVTAVNSAGSSTNSNEASATPQAGSGGETGSKALLVITMTNGLEKEYDLSMTDINAFINWYDGKASGNGQGYYAFNKTFNLGPFLTRVDYITYDKIQNFEIMQYQ